MYAMPSFTFSYRSSLFFLLFFCFLFSGCGLINRKPNVSGLQVTTDGISASVLLNGSKVGSTPYSDQNLEPGTYTVRIEPEDDEFATYETSVTLYTGTLAVMNWTLGKTPETSGGVIYEMEPLKKKKEANLSIASIPDGAIVKVDDVSEGFTPVLLKTMTVGSHRFQVTLPSYKDEEQTVNIAEGFQMNVTVKLAKQKVATTSDVETEVASDSAIATSSAKTASSSATPTPKSRLDSVSSELKESTGSARTTGASTTTSGKMLTIKETGTGWLRVRAKAGTAGEELAKVDVGDSFPYFEVANGWYEIEYEKGKKGWVNGQYVKTN